MGSSDSQTGTAVIYLVAYMVYEVAKTQSEAGHLCGKVRVSKFFNDFNVVETSSVENSLCTFNIVLEPKASTSIFDLISKFASAAIASNATGKLALRDNDLHLRLPVQPFDTAVDRQPFTPAVCLEKIPPLDSLRSDSMILDTSNLEIMRGWWRATHETSSAKMIALAVAGASLLPGVYIALGGKQGIADNALALMSAELKLADQYKTAFRRAHGEVRRVWIDRSGTEKQQRQRLLAVLVKVLAQTEHPPK